MKWDENHVFSVNLTVLQSKNNKISFYIKLSREVRLRK